MKLVDANVLLYAVDADADRHEPAREWLDRALSGADVVAFSWIVLLAFLRLATKVGLYPDPMPVGDALRQIDAWTSSTNGRIVSATPSHLRVLEGVLREVGTGGNLVNDAHLVALALEHKASIVTYDHDFARFPRIEWDRPEDLLR